MPGPLDRFHRTLRNLNVTRIRMELLYRRGDIVLRDLDSIYESLFLRSVTSFELFLEELFIGVLRGKVAHSSCVVERRMHAKSDKALMEIILQGGDYLDWLPFNKTEDRAKIYLEGGRPFSLISDGDRSQIKCVSTIRNAIAHTSSYALRKFQNQVVGQQKVLPHERKPAGFLRTQYRMGQTRFEGYISDLGRIAKTLC